jgi:hypothetical protein
MVKRSAMGDVFESIKRGMIGAIDFVRGGEESAVHKYSGNWFIAQIRCIHRPEALITTKADYTIIADLPEIGPAVGEAVCKL